MPHATALRDPASSALRAVGAVLLGAALAGPATAAIDIDHVDVYRNVGMLQTANGPVLGGNGSFFSTSVYTLGGVAYSGAEVAFAGPSSPQPLGAGPGPVYSYQSPVLADKAALDAAFPPGRYDYTLRAPGGDTLSSLTIGADAYALSLPYLDGSSYTLLQGADAAAPHTLSFSPFVVNPAASASLVFFTLYDYTTAQWVRQDNAMPAGTTGTVIPAGQLMPGHQYAYELGFSSRVLTVIPDTVQSSQIGYELRTMGLFTTAVPEPATWALLLAGLTVLGVRGRGNGA